MLRRAAADILDRGVSLKAVARDLRDRGIPAKHPGVRVDA